MRLCLSCFVNISTRANRAIRCVSCARKRHVRLMRQRNAEYKCSAKGRTTQKAYNQRHKVQIKLLARRIRARHRDRYRKYLRDWKLLNPGAHAAHGACRRAAQKQATPGWVDQAALLAIYEQAALSGKHVDHIIPLQHPDVCGLHVPWNLQLLTPTENMSKSNKFET